MLAVIAAIVVVAVASRFIFGTLLADRGVAREAAALTGIVTGMAFLLAGWGIGTKESWIDGRSVGAMALGALVAVAVPLIELTHQYSDAPTGTLVLFWTAVVPGALLLVAGFRGDLRVRGVLAALTVLAAAGAAGVLTNWERPSSFSLLAKHVPEQLWLGAAGALWVACIVGLAALVRTGSWPSVARSAGAGGVVAGVVLALTGSESGAAVSAVSNPTVLAYAASTAVLAVAVLLVTSRGRVTVAAPGLLAAPSVLSLLVLVEAAVGILGPEPILRVPVMWGSALVVAALIAAAYAEVRPGRPLVAAGTRIAVLRALAIAGTFAALVGLWLGALDVSVAGRLADTTRFAAEFTMSGFETVGAWIALGACLVALSLLYVSSDKRVVLSSAGVVAVAIGAWRVIGYTPLHTWVTWIPADVQQDYGTEYASILFEPTMAGWQIAALAIAAAVTVAVVVDTVRASRSVAPGLAEESDES